MNINYNHLRYFWYIAKEGHLTRAAQQLNLSQSALSTQLKTLEGNLGHPLFERTSKALKLTRVGRILFEYCDDFFRAGEDLLYQLRHRIDLSSQQLRLGATVQLSRNFQIDLIGRLPKNRVAGLTLIADSLEALLVRLQRHQLDLVMSNTPPPYAEDSPFVCHEIARQRLAVLCRRDRAGRARSAQALLQKQPLLLPDPSSHLRHLIDAWLERKGLRPAVAAQVSDMTMLRLLAREGYGAAILPPIVVKDEIADGVVRIVEELDELEEVFYGIVLKGRDIGALLPGVVRARGGGM